jgi:hypothetical protein
MKRITAAALGLCLVLSVWAQDADSIVLAYRRNFARSSLVTKLELLKEAAQRKDVAMGPLFDMALRFAVDNSALLGPDPQLRDLALVASAAVGAAAYSPAVDDLWALFQAFKDQDIRASALVSLGITGMGETRIAENLNAFLASQNSLFRSGVPPEYVPLEACIDALGKLGEGSSFPVLFSAYVAGYNPGLGDKAAKALASIKGDYKGYLLRVIVRNPPIEKAAAFSAGMANADFDDSARGEIAESAISAALDSTAPSPVELQALRELRFSAAKKLKELKWQKASPLAIRHFRLVQADYAKGAATKAELLDAVDLLGSMGSTEAAQALALQLQLINVQTEQGAPYDESLILAVCSSLGELGDKAAFDYLLQVGYLQYSDTIKRAAREALMKLKW